MITTTLNRIKSHSPCKDGWENLLKHLGKTKSDDDPLPFSVIVESNGIEDALWCCRAEPQHSKEWRLYAVWCARQVEHLTESEASRNALNVAEAFAYGKATGSELAAARAAARTAARAAAGEAALAAARTAARAAACAAAWDSAWDAAWAAARAAAGEAAWAAVQERPKVKFLEIVGA